MSGSRGLAILLTAILAGPVLGQGIPFSDDFENGMGNWHRWPEATETLQWDQSVSRSPTHAARSVEADPWGYASYADVGAQSGGVYAEVFVYDEFDDDGTVYARPVSNMLALIGADLSPTPPLVTYHDYLQSGVVAWYDPAGLTQKYYIRTRYRDTHGQGYLDTGVYRRRGWRKLAIDADALEAGGQVRFYIDDRLVGVSQRTEGESLRYVRLGLNFKSYDNFWYDDVRVLAARPCNATLQDADGDGDVDLADFGVFQGCFNGPNRPWNTQSANAARCECFDREYDGDVDLSDFAAFQSCFNGPNRPPTCM